MKDDVDPNLGAVSLTLGLGLTIAFLLHMIAHIIKMTADLTFDTYIYLKNL